MPRIGKRKEVPATTNNNAGEEKPSVSKPKIRRLQFKLELPQRGTVLGHALVCGQGDVGQLGLGEDDAKMERRRPAVVDSIENVVDVYAGGMHNLVLTADGILYSFGCNDEGALGRDSSQEGSEFEPHKIDLPGKVLKISAGDSHSACLLEDGRVFAWGSFRNSHGNMGLTMEGNKRLPVEILPDLQCCDIASGEDHLIILTDDGKVYTIGSGEQGQLGRISMRSASGDGRFGKSNLLQPSLVRLRSTKPIDGIWATNFCSFLRESQSGRIWAFGLNNYKQLAYDKDIGIIFSPILTQLKNVKQIAGGQHHTLILRNDGSCAVIGRCDYGRLGLGKLTEDVKQVTEIPELSGKRIVNISCGGAQSFAVTDDGQVYAWGMGSNYQLGTGSEDDAMEPVQIVSKQTQNKRIIRVSSGGQHSIFLVEDNVQPDSTVSEYDLASTLPNTDEDRVEPAEAKAASATVSEPDTAGSQATTGANKNDDTESVETPSEIGSEIVDNGNIDDGPKPPKRKRNKKETEVDNKE